MQINRQTYEEYFLLYTDGELSAEEKRAVEEFVQENPDLKQELILLQESVFAPDETILFDNKEVLYRQEKKVVAFPWLRMAVAATLLLTLTTIGWLYLGDPDDAPQQVVASKELIRDQNNGSMEEPRRSEPSVTTVSEEIIPPSEKIDRMVRERKVPVVITIENNTGTVGNSEAARSAPNNYVSSTREIKTSPTQLDHDVITTPSATEIIDVAVAPRSIEQPEQSATNEDASESVRYVQAEEDEMIYFANTSLPKKSKLRGVFRKATRFLDKVTSLQ